MPARAATAKRKLVVAAPPNERLRVWAVCGLLLAAIALVYGQTLGHGFLNFDDNAFVFNNRHVTSGLTAQAVWWALTDGPIGEWYPMACLSHIVDWQLYGPRAGGHHLTSVLIHAAASLALFLVWRQMTGRLWPSALVAAVFALHPQHVESVAWVAERRDVLSGLFFMLTLAAYLGYVRHDRTPARYLLVAVMFSLALMSKPTVVALPALLLLLDYWPLGRIGSMADSHASAPVERPGAGGLVLEKLPLVALAVAASLITLRTHNAGGTPVAWSVRLGNAAISCVTYIAQFFYPVWLSAIYPLPPGGHPVWKVAGACAILGLVTAGATIGRRHYPYVFVGWFWFLGMLAPVLGLVHVSTHAMADRYTYLPSIGLAIALVFAGAQLAAARPAWRRELGALAALTVIVLAACSFRQTTFWRDDAALWRHALACDPANGEAEFGLGFALQQQGLRDQAMVHYRLAEEHAIDSSPFINLGILLAQQGKLNEAIAEYRRALALDSTSTLSVQARARLGEALIETNEFDEAEPLLRRAADGPSVLGCRTRLGLAGAAANHRGRSEECPRAQRFGNDPV